MLRALHFEAVCGFLFNTPNALFNRIRMVLHVALLNQWMYAEGLHFFRGMKLVAGLAVLWLWVAEAVENCPSVCKCSQKLSTEKTEVNCQKRGLENIPSLLPLDSWILKMGEQRNSFLCKVIHEQHILPSYHLTFIPHTVYTFLTIVTIHVYTATYETSKPT